MAAGYHNEFRTEGTRGPLCLMGWVPEGAGGVKLSHLGVSKYRTIWLKTAVFPIWPRAKMGDFGPPKKAYFWPPKKGKIWYLGSPYTTQVKVTHQHSVVPWVGSALVVIKKVNRNCKDLKYKKVKKTDSNSLISILQTRRVKNDFDIFYNAVPCWQSKRTYIALKKASWSISKVVFTSYS